MSAVNPAVPPTNGPPVSAEIRDNFATIKTELEALETGKADTSHTHPDATTSVAGFMSSADKTKLDGIASGATANSADAFLLDRANHSGTQTASTISDFAATVQSTNARVTVENNGTVVGVRRAINFIPGTNVSLTITDDPANEEVDVTINSTGGSGASIDVQTFTASGTWTKPAGAKRVVFDAIAPGGGGGSGRKGAAASVRCGGGGGGPGARSIATVDAAILAATATITIGAIGTGGAAQATNSTNGVNGTAAGNVTVTSGGRSICAASGGQAGSGGTNAAGAAGANRTGYFEMVTVSGVAGAAASTTGAAGNAAANSLVLLPTGGGSGGGITSGNAASAGGGGGIITFASLGTTVDRGAAGAIATNGGNGNALTPALVGTGGGGGGSSLVGNAGAGGNGGNYGAGGGGGGAAVDGVGNSGKGGDGAPGVVIVTTYF